MRGFIILINESEIETNDLDTIFPKRSLEVYNCSQLKSPLWRGRLSPFAAWKELTDLKKKKDTWDVISVSSSYILFSL